MNLVNFAAQFRDLGLEQPKHCKCRNSNLRPFEFLRVNRLLQGVWRDAPMKPVLSSPGVFFCGFLLGNLG